MIYRLINAEDPRKTLVLKDRTWLCVLDTAEEFGWNPLGTVQPELWMNFASGINADAYAPMLEPLGDYSPWTRSKVLLEDALNLADALERFFLEVDPAPYDYHASAYHTEFDGASNGHRPAIGVILLVVDFCRDGSFLIERS